MVRQDIHLLLNGEKFKLALEAFQCRCDKFLDKLAQISTRLGKYLEQYLILYLLQLLRLFQIHS